MYESEHFTKVETGCRCGNCGGEQGMTDDTLRKFDALRDACGFPLPMTSGYRCPLHLKNLNGVHGDGNGGDIAVNRRQAFIVLKHAIALGFTGIGVKQKGAERFIHLDDSTRPDKLRPTIWSY